MRVSRQFLLLALIILVGGTVIASTDAAIGRRYVVMVGKEEGREAVFSCTNEEIDFFVQLHPYGGGSAYIPTSGMPCSPESFEKLFPGGSPETFNNPAEGWTVNEDELTAERCDYAGDLLQVGVGPARWPDVKSEPDSPSC